MIFYIGFQKELSLRRPCFLSFLQDSPVVGLNRATLSIFFRFLQCSWSCKPNREGICSQKHLSDFLQFKFYRSIFFLDNLEENFEDDRRLLFSLLIKANVQDLRSLVWDPCHLIFITWSQCDQSHFFFFK